MLCLEQRNRGTKQSLRTASPCLSPSSNHLEEQRNETKWANASQLNFQAMGDVLPGAEEQRNKTSPCNASLCVPW